MKLWALMHSYSDGCTFWGRTLVSLHSSEEGAFLEIDVARELPDPDFPEQKMYPVDDCNDFIITEWELKP